MLAGCVAVCVWQGFWFASEYEYFLGQKKLAAKNYDAATKNLSTALALYPANTEAGFKLGQVFLGQQKYEQAQHTFEKTLAAASYYEEVYFQAALAALGAKDTKKAIHYLVDHLKLAPYHLTAYKLLSALLHENSIYADEENLALLERALRLFPCEMQLWQQLGEIYQKRSDAEYAKNTYQRGLEIDTLNKTLLKSLAAFYPDKTQEPALLSQARRLQGYEEKVEKFDKMSPYYQHKLRENLEAYITQYPDDINGKILLARVFSLGGNDLKAEEILEQVLSAQPGNLWANLALSSLYYQAEDWTRAQRALEEALFYYPENITAQTRLNALKQKTGK